VVAPSVLVLALAACVSSSNSSTTTSGNQMVPTLRRWTRSATEPAGPSTPRRVTGLHRLHGSTAPRISATHHPLVRDQARRLHRLIPEVSLTCVGRCSTHESPHPFQLELVREPTAADR
jgi:hypothetical protein